MYSFTDPRLVTASLSSSSSCNKSPLLSPPTTFSPSMHPFFQAFGQLPPFAPFHHSLSPSNHIPPPPNLFFHPHHAHPATSNSSNFFLFPHLPLQLKNPPQISIPSPPTIQLQSPPQLICKEKSSSPETVTSTTVTSTKNSCEGKVYYSNKRKEYEAREEKKVNNSSDKKKCENSSDLQSDSFCCPICSESGFKGDTLKEHFELELKKFKCSESCKNKSMKKHQSHEATKIAPFPVDEDDDVFASGTRDQQSASGLSSWTRCSRTSSPTSVSSELEKRWEKFRSIRRNRCRRQHRGLISRSYTWNPTSASASASTSTSAPASVAPDHGLRGSPLFLPRSPPLASPFSSSLVQSSSTTLPASSLSSVSGANAFAYSSFLGEGSSDCPYPSPHQPVTSLGHEEIGSKKSRLSLTSSSSSSISASSPASVCSNNSRTSTPNKVECASSPEK